MGAACQPVKYPYTEGRMRVVLMRFGLFVFNRLRMGMHVHMHRSIVLMNQRESKPTTATPAEWPMPQRNPGDQARVCVRTANGAMAARWSGPDHT